MKYLIVNGDDFGASPGINRGIMEAHQHGILTSTSLLVKTPGAEQAVSLAAASPELSVGLHMDLRNEIDETPHCAGNFAASKNSWVVGRRTLTRTTMSIGTRERYRISLI